MKHLFRFFVLVNILLLMQYCCKKDDDKPVNICDGSLTAITDIDGNNYRVVSIGSQCWTVENLKTTKYSDGSLIPNILNDSIWAITDSGATCSYENNFVNDHLYGKLYNWFAVSDPRNLCPIGWHVPNNLDWSQLNDFLGGSSIAGGKMKALDLWQLPNTGATNSSGFSAVPSGLRWYNNGLYQYQGKVFDCWSNTESDSLKAYHKTISYSDGILSNAIDDKHFGFSVRCIRD